MGIFDFLKKLQPGRDLEAPEEAGKLTFGKIIAAAHREMSEKGHSYWDVKPNEYKSFTTLVLPLPDKQKVAFIIHAIGVIQKDKYGQQIWRNDNATFMKASILESFMTHLLKM